MPNSIYLPTEIVVLIVSLAAGSSGETQRQSTLYACCLVSQQWYSAAVSFLYRKPRLKTGRSFAKFTRTVAPPLGERKSKLNLGEFVHRLDLGSLVHESSKSLTARLLGRIKTNLESFVAPSLSFSSNSLPALSKCTNLHYLDLSLVGDPIPFTNLKKALNNLPKLTTVRLPRSTNLTDLSPTSQSIPWPPRLHRLQLSGRFSPFTIPTFAWPPSLTSLTLKNCQDLSVNHIGSLMSSPQLGRTLRRLTISCANRGLHPESINAVPAFLPDLTYLCVPGDLVDDMFFELLTDKTHPIALQELVFDHPFSDPELGFSTQALIAALHAGLVNLQNIGFAERFCTDERIIADEELDTILTERAPSGKDDVVCGVYYV
ncbi:F-box domain protein [Aspergillus campestris IBT 28561]|uniref:F-box domain protein n=1 Tax=Aspergillus campestris (strain IBT 28561) TaxID=1392248 RepID=A0A2I1D9M0_ASPC2|nr:F-box domain protein [Aspergillus campestris IBT 28561]PKY06556.1 F-box domain protein [Aspergillus campestris IBT 28561]